GISLEEPGSVRLIRWSRVRVPPRSLAKEPARTRLRPPIHLGCVNRIRIPDRARTRPDLTLHVCRALPVALPARYPMTPTWPPWWMHGPNCPRPSRPASWRWSRPPRGARNSRGLTGEIGASPPVAAGPFQHFPPKSGRTRPRSAGVDEHAWGHLTRVPRALLRQRQSHPAVVLPAGSETG